MKPPLTPRPHGIPTRNFLFPLAMFLSLMLFSGQPVIAAWGDGNSNPFLLNSAWRTGLVSGRLAHFPACYRTILLNTAVIRQIPKSAFPFQGNSNTTPGSPGNEPAKSAAQCNRSDGPFLST